MTKRHLLLTIASSALLACSLSAAPASAAHVGGFGRSMAGGSGGLATGPTNFTGVFGRSSGGRATGYTDFQLLGSSMDAGSGGRATGSTNPVRPRFGGE